MEGREERTENLALDMRLPILAYHSIDNLASSISVSPRSFCWQMEALKRWGYQGVSLSDWISSRYEDRSKVCVITFDDGYRNNYEYALPVLEGLGFTATFFIVTNAVGGADDWQKDDGWNRRLLSWNQIREMAECGMDFQPHGHTHRNLTMLKSEDIRSELMKSRETIEGQIGGNGDLFCYPYGGCDERVVEIVRELSFRAAVTTRLGGNCSRNDLFKMERIGSHWFRRSDVLFRLFLEGCDSPFFLRIAHCYARARKATVGCI